MKVMKTKNQLNISLKKLQYLKFMSLTMVYQKYVGHINHVVSEFFKIA